jgi:hypothetical protein
MSVLRTYSGRNFDPLSRTPGKIDIEDIAHALSNICRYTGHCSKFYSVAQHSVIVVRIIKGFGGPKEVQLQGLLHDATEAYMNDIARPLKLTAVMDAYRSAEHDLERVLAKHWGFETLTPEPVKLADRICLATEARDLMGDPKDWNIGVGPIQMKIDPLPPESAKKLFLTQYNELMKETGRYV